MDPVVPVGLDPLAPDGPGIGVGCLVRATTIATSAAAPNPAGQIHRGTPVEAGGGGSGAGGGGGGGGSGRTSSSSGTGLGIGGGGATGRSPLRALLKSSIDWSRSDALTARPLITAASIAGSISTPIALGRSSLSSASRSSAGCGIFPVIEWYNVAAVAYTSVQGPWIPLARYCSSGA